ncbi:copper chaperone PCu(A)C [Robbsia sp. Bb-Pol-6]|uniref:Copper chaperone PCu(A)C n=1 Tax=Robbsia betulipollinis TaxID=2981849 RepID=A0ABT3ZPR0_9BURK|nr:copper chaperone PCu(A)C [Robbsia betulipollinis]MCY0388528.1 copper chaperone PCu(A)C [Robbsia betulipollinis]
MHRFRPPALSAPSFPPVPASRAHAGAGRRAALPAARRRLLAALLFSVGSIGLAHAAETARSAVHAPERAAPQSPVRVSHAWIRWLPSQLPAAGYMVLENTGERPLDLIGVASPDYADVMLHRTLRNGATTTMEMTPTLALPPHEKVAIAPGGYHLMLEKPTRALAPGATVQLELRFSDGAAMRTAVPVSAPTRTQ